MHFAWQRGNLPFQQANVLPAGVSEVGAATILCLQPEVDRSLLGRSRGSRDEQEHRGEINGYATGVQPKLTISSHF